MPVADELNYTGSLQNRQTPLEFQVDENVSGKQRELDFCLSMSPHAMVMIQRKECIIALTPEGRLHYFFVPRPDPNCKP
jgi:hypothetical protein